MSKYLRWIRQNLNNIYRFLITSMTIILISLLFPNLGNFKYEYQKGKPWMHETLIAPFDFAILKTDSEVLQEKDSILNKFYPFFTIDPSVFEKVTEEFNTDFDKKWKKFVSSKSFQKSNKSKNSIQREHDKIKEYLLSYFKNIYDNGVANLQNE